MKRKIALCLTLALALSSLSGCFVFMPRQVEDAVDKMEEKIEKSIESFGEDMEEWAENFSQYAELGENIVEIEVYDVASGKLLRSITDEETMRVFEQSLGSSVDKHFNSYHSVAKMMRETFTTPKRATEEYRFDLYQASVAEVNKGELFKVLSITTYEDREDITLRVDSDVAKGLVVPKNLLTFTIELKEDAIAQLRALAEE